MDMHICRVCNINKKLDLFPKNSRYKNGKDTICKDCSCKLSHRTRTARPEYYKEFDKNRRRNNHQYIFRRRYSSLKLRYNRGYLKGRDDMPLIDIDEFMSWCNRADVIADFNKLHKEYVDSGYSNKYLPTIDRIDNLKGYTTDNIRWLRRSDNSSLGASKDSREKLKNHLTEVERLKSQKGIA